MNNQNGFVPGIFIALWVSLGLVCLWHIPAYQKAKAARHAADAAQAQITANRTTE